MAFADSDIWRMGMGSNHRGTALQAVALPTELPMRDWLQRLDLNQRSRAYETREDDRTPLLCCLLVVYEDLNLGPLRPKRSALTKLSYTPKTGRCDRT